MYVHRKGMLACWLNKHRTFRQLVLNQQRMIWGMHQRRARAKASYVRDRKFGKEVWWSMDRGSVAWPLKTNFVYKWNSVNTFISVLFQNNTVNGRNSLSCELLKLLLFLNLYTIGGLGLGPSGSRSRALGLGLGTSPGSRSWSWTIRSRLLHWWTHRQRYEP